MKITKTRAQMLDYVRTALLLNPERSDGAIEYTDGLDIDSAIINATRARYLNLLDNGSREQLAPEDVSDDVSVGATLPGGGVRLILPPSTRRVFDVALDGWLYPVEIQPADRLRCIVAEQFNPFTRATVEQPVAVIDTASTAGRLTSILCWPAATQINMLTAVVDPGENKYILDESALNSLIPRKL